MQLEKALTSVFRLIGVYEDETAFILPIQPTAASDTTRMVSVSTRERLVFVGPANVDEIRQSPAFTSVEQRCAELVRSYMSSIHVLVTTPNMDAVARGNQMLKDSQDVRFDDAHHSNDNYDDDDDIALTYDEIDDIYRYVRQGGEPPRPRPRPQGATNTSCRQQSLPVSGDEQTAPDWEEPIYEDIEKIRQRKRQRATMTEASKTTTTNALKTTTTTIDVQESQSRGDYDMLPIGNLRELIKRFSMLESTTSSKSSTSTPPVKLRPPVTVKPPATVEDATSFKPTPIQNARLGPPVEATVDSPTLLTSSVPMPKPAVDMRPTVMVEPMAAVNNAPLSTTSKSPEKRGPSMIEKSQAAIGSSPSVPPKPIVDSDKNSRNEVDTLAATCEPANIKHLQEDSFVFENAAGRDTSPQTAEHDDMTSLPIDVESAPTTCSTYAGCTTSIRVSRDNTRRQLNDSTSPFFCSRVSVIGAATSVQPMIVDRQTSVTKITTLSRQSERRTDVHQNS